MRTGDRASMRTSAFASAPETVRAAVDPRADRLRAGAAGRILDLDDLSPGDLNPGDLDDASAPDGSYDTIVSIGGLARHADLPAAVAYVRRRLAPDGMFVFVEPVGLPGWRGVALASAGTHLRGARGLHLGRDVPATIRESGLLVTRIDRFAVPTASLSLRHFVEGAAMFMPEATADGSAPGDRRATGTSATGELREGKLREGENGA